MLLFAFDSGWNPLSKDWPEFTLDLPKLSVHKPALIRATIPQLCDIYWNCSMGTQNGNKLLLCKIFIFSELLEKESTTEHSCSPYPQHTAGWWSKSDSRLETKMCRLLSSFGLPPCENLLVCLLKGWNLKVTHLSKPLQYFFHFFVSPEKICQWFLHRVQICQSLLLLHYQLLNSMMGDRFLSLFILC